ncbi:hypothetical protein RHSIM_Rhsim08G0131000 [Rhododendron simsii]|uniref:Uncharacterized protein n=1 Tax=Rhododendron simsii TaxID=118357 RepID=A0A834GME6_RHOSS|nr:hypothetical protein RHSIM_Rhsim08G0131000 [Rhododendron simsii]
MSQAKMAKQINKLPLVEQEYENRKAVPNQIVLGKMKRILGDDKGSSTIFPPLFFPNPPPTLINIVMNSGGKGKCWAGDASQLWLLTLYTYLQYDNRFWNQNPKFC